MARPPHVHVNIRSAEPGRPPKAADIVAAIQAEVTAGRLPAGSRVPPVRVLEHQLGISKNTVQAAYDELQARAVLESRAREGVFVAAPTGETPEAPGGPRPASPRIRSLTLPPHRHPGRDDVALSNVFIDPDLLPVDRITECMRSVLASPGIDTRYDAMGLPSLRRHMARRLSARGIEADPDDVVVTCGSQQAIDAVCRAVDTRRIATENPAYSHAKTLFRSLDLDAIGLPLDPFGGIDLDDWEARIDAFRPGLVYLVTSFQNPTGYSYTTHELMRILELSARYDFTILEDDWGSDMLSGAEYRPTLRALGGPDVLYVNSFTKKLLPSLRLGFLVANPRVTPTLAVAKRLTTLGNPAVMEATLDEFLDRGYYDGHLRRLQEALDARYRACLDSLRELMPPGVRWTTPGGGPTLWVELPRSVDLEGLTARLAGRGVLIESRAHSFFGEPHLHGFQLSYAFSPEDRLRRGIETLAAELTASS